MEVDVPQKDATEIIVNPRGKCKDCIYSKPMTEVDDDFDEENVNRVQCRRRSPISGWFPTLVNDSWCGDYSDGNKPQELEFG